LHAYAFIKFLKANIIIKDEDKKDKINTEILIKIKNPYGANEKSNKT
jgi:hypothetical protein